MWRIIGYHFLSFVKQIKPKIEIVRSTTNLHLLLLQRSTNMWKPQKDLQVQAYWKTGTLVQIFQSQWISNRMEIIIAAFFKFSKWLWLSNTNLTLMHLWLKVEEYQYYKKYCLLYRAPSFYINFLSQSVCDSPTQSDQIYHCSKKYWIGETCKIIILLTCDGITICNDFSQKVQKIRVEKLSSFL